MITMLTLYYSFLIIIDLHKEDTYETKYSRVTNDEDHNSTERRFSLTSISSYEGYPSPPATSPRPRHSSKPPTEVHKKRKHLIKTTSEEILTKNPTRTSEENYPTKGANTEHPASNKMKKGLRRRKSSVERR